MNYLNPTYNVFIDVDEIGEEVYRYAAVHVPGGTATSVLQLIYFNGAEITWTREARRIRPASHLCSLPGFVASSHLIAGG